VSSNRRIDIVGHSRGGYLAIEVARNLQTVGINGKPVDVRFLGLYDPVDSAIGYGVAETISSNVQTVAVVYAAGTVEEVGTDERFQVVGNQVVLIEQRSRWIFNRADHGPVSAKTDFDQIWIFGTHSAIGGAPWEGDGPSPGTLANPALAGHTETNDRAKAILSDQHVRNKARSKNLPINLVDDYGYQWLDD